VTWVGRIIGLCCFGLCLAGYALGPRLLDLGPEAAELWPLLQILCIAIAAATCFLAAWHGQGCDRKAWNNFGIGCSIYLAGNLYYTYVLLSGQTPAFPSLPEAAFFIMAGFFARGMHQYGNVSERVSRVHFYNFALLYCGVAASCLFLLRPLIEASILSPLGTSVAFLYPALWFSVAGFGLISMLLYEHGKRFFPLVLLFVAVLAEAIADFVYARGLMSGTFDFDGPTRLLWFASTIAIVWAALEQLHLARHRLLPADATMRQSGRRLTQAAVPAAAIAILLLSGSLSGAFGESLFSVALSAGVAVAFAVAAGLREHWIIRVQHQLHGAVEDSRADLAEAQRRLASVLHSTSDSVVVVDPQWRVEYCNQRASEMIGDTRGLQLGSSFWDVFPVAADSPNGLRLIQAAAAGQPVEFEERIEASGVWLDVHAYPTDEGVSVFFRDLGRNAMRCELSAALGNDEFAIAYQPILDLRSGKVSAFEALLRWHHPTRGLVSPEVFIPLAEETGLICEIGNWVLRTACAEAASWPAAISLAVNLSTRQFASPDLADQVRAALVSSGLDSSRLELEITESVLLKDSRANLQTLARFRGMGVRVALDDFGTGYSSLGYLQKFQFSKLKIDRSFVSGLPDSEESQAIVRAVIGLGKSLGMRVTAEGVESQEQLDWIAAGCDEAQGYLLSRPVPAADIPALLLKFAAGRPEPGRAKARRAG
jgi:EAL domain-containing protein (putative c-di-GMP-specific phosphodiesterase class I)